MFAQFTQTERKSKMEFVFLFLRYWGSCINGIFKMLLYLIVGTRLEDIYKSWSANMAILFIGASLNSFLSAMFILPIGGSLCTIACVTPLNCNTMVTFLIHVYLYNSIFSPERERERY